MKQENSFVVFPSFFFMETSSSLYLLSADHRTQLLQQPETGMGYQLVPDEANNLLVASNGKTLLRLPETTQPAVPRPILLQAELLHATTLAPYEQLRVLHNRRYDQPNELLPAEESPFATTDELPPFTYFTRRGDEFVRLSAYSDDFRVLPEGGLAAGSYATTLSDLKVVPSGIAAVGRYALPNHAAARYTYLISPPAGTKILFGTVAPNYGLCGGGVEVYFADELPICSVRIFDTIPVM